MLRHTFQHFRGITAKRERALWRQGVFDWEGLRATVDPQPSLFDERDDRGLLFQVGESERSLALGDASHFVRTLDKRERYRICLEFPRDVLFLDIETTGLSRYYDQITVIGWALGPRYGFWVKGQGDEAFRSAIAAARAVVTFNGTLFDIPFIAHELPQYTLPECHVDLRFIAKRAGLTGGQKAIECQLGIRRNTSVQGIEGESAPILWNRYTRGDLSALQLLVEYNAADIWGMKQIFDVAVRRLLEEQGYPLHVLSLPRLQDIEFETRSQRLEESINDVLIPWRAPARSSVQIDDLVFVDRAPRLKVVGIDLTGSEARPTGWCLLDGREVITARLGGDEEIVARTVKEHPHLVSIDSPLSLPEGRTSVGDDDPGRREFGIMRHSERVLKRRGVNVYPALIPSMQRLTARGIRLAKAFRSLGFPVIESYPGAAQDIMGIPRKRKGLEYLERGLAEFGVSGRYITQSVSHDELDAITSAIVGVFFWAGRFERLGPDALGEEALIIPELRDDPTPRRGRLVVGLSGPLGAGKTTAARYLEMLGCHYCRYSEVIARLVSAAKPDHTRADLQREGQRVHEQLGQRWLGRELLRPLSPQPFVVIDGLRFPDDHAFLTEIFGSQLLHIHVVARRSLRRERYEAREGADFEAADAHAVEQRSTDLEVFARDIIENDGSLENFHRCIDRIVRRNWR
jgi:uncharacterized protein YprB with RNaseH-like and TPR domain/predicted nuclease with RNAse H fold/dephospho-CoA kinase